MTRFRIPARSFGVISLCALVSLLETGCPRASSTRATSSVASAPTPSAAPDQTPASREFSERVRSYVKLRRQLESSLPTLKPTKDVSSIGAHEQALAKKIYDARREARQGDIFAPDVSAEFRQRLADVFHGPQSLLASATIKQGEPVKAVNLKVDESYPDGTPVTTVPPTVLQKLPPLPPDIEYRIVGRYLVLQDLKANLIIDFIDGAIPVKVSK